MKHNKNFFLYLSIQPKGGKKKQNNLENNWVEIQNSTNGISVICNLVNIGVINHIHHGLLLLESELEWDIEISILLQAKSHLFDLAFSSTFFFFPLTDIIGKKKKKTNPQTCQC